MRPSIESTTALSSISRIDDRAHDALGIGQRLERGVRSAAEKLIDCVGSGRDADSPYAERPATLDVGGRVTDDDEILSVDVDAKLGSRPALGDRWQLRTELVIAPERADAKAIGIDPRRAKLRVCAFSQIPREKAKNGIPAPLESLQQLEDSGMNERGDAFELVLEAGEIERHQRIHTLVDMRIVMSLQPHHLADDLRIGLAIITMILGTRGPEDLAECHEHGPTASAIALQDGSVDVEQNEPHGTPGHHSGNGSAVRVRST